MDEKMDKLKQQELNLERAIEENEYLQRQVANVEENYQDFFYKSNRLFDELSEQFNQNDFGVIMEDQYQALRYDQSYIFEELSEEHEMLRKDHWTMEEDLNEIYFEKKKLTETGKEEKHGN